MFDLLFLKSRGATYCRAAVQRYYVAFIETHGAAVGYICLGHCANASCMAAPPKSVKNRFYFSSSFLELAAAIILGGDIDVATLGTNEVHQLAEREILYKKGGIANHNEIEAGTGHGNV